VSDEKAPLERWRNLLKAGLYGGTGLMLAGVVKLLLAWLSARAGRADFTMVAKETTVSLEIFSVGLVLVILALIGRAIVRSRAGRPDSGVRG
jgi:hypothetical protein